MSALARPTSLSRLLPGKPACMAPRTLCLHCLGRWLQASFQCEPHTNRCLFLLDGGVALQCIAVHLSFAYALVISGLCPAHVAHSSVFLVGLVQCGPGSSSAALRGAVAPSLCNFTTSLFCVSCWGVVACAEAAHFKFPQPSPPPSPHPRAPHHRYVYIGVSYWAVGCYMEPSIGPS